MPDRADWLRRRAEAEERAATLIENHEGTVMRFVAQAARDLAPETADLSQVAADIRLAAEVSRRLDRAVTLPNALAEAADGPVLFFVSLAAISLWRGLQRRERNRGARAHRLAALLEEYGEDMAAKRRRRLKRRLKRLRAQLDGVTA